MTAASIARALRPLAMCLLIIVIAGIVPAAGSCLEDLLGCETICTRCSCKHPTGSTTVRKACPCCQQHPGLPDSLTGMAPAVLPGPSSPLVMPRAIPPAPGRPGRAPSFSPSVPHPPPRAL